MEPLHCRLRVDGFAALGREEAPVDGRHGTGHCLHQSAMAIVDSPRQQSLLLRKIT